MELKHIVDLVYLNIYGKPKMVNNLNKKTKNINIKKFFISDFELKKKYFNPETKTITIPSNAIISPLSIDWIDYENIKIVIKNE